MKKVLYLYDSLSQEINEFNLTQIESYKQYAFEDVFISKIEEIDYWYEQVCPDVLILNSQFDFNNQIEIIKSISRTQKYCKIIMVIDNKEFQEMLFNSQIPHRIFYKNVAKDILANTISSLFEEYNLTLDEIYRIKIFNDLIESLDLKKYNAATRHFIKCLYILYNNISLLDGHLNNAYYVVSKYDNVSFNAVKKSISRVIETIKYSSNTEYLCSIFGYSNIKFHTPTEIFHKIIGYMKKQS